MRDLSNWEDSSRDPIRALSEPKKLMLVDRSQHTGLTETQKSDETLPSLLLMMVYIAWSFVIKFRIRTTDSRIKTMMSVIKSR